MRILRPLQPTAWKSLQDDACAGAARRRAAPGIAPVTESPRPSTSLVWIVAVESLVEGADVP